MGRALYYAMPDELVNEAIDRAAAMAKELVKVNAGTLDDKDKAVASADFADLVEMIRSIGATKH
jgi:hypothetical protein